MRPTTVRQFRNAYQHAIEVANVRADREANLLAVGGVLAWFADLTRMTTRPTWARLMEQTGLARSTVGSALAWFKAQGLLGVVAGGRSAGMQLRRDKFGPPRADAAVYVLAVPKPVERTRTPRVLSTTTTYPTPARKTETEKDALRARSSGSVVGAAPASEPVAGGTDAAFNDDAWAGDGRVTRRAARRMSLSAAEALQDRLPVLRRSSVRAIAAVIRPWLAADWTVADLHHAVDWRPDDTRPPHYGAYGVVHPARWLMYRFVAWMGDDGQPLPSKSQRSLARARQIAAGTRQQRELHALDATRNHSPTTEENIVRASGLAAARAALQAARANGGQPMNTASVRNTAAYLAAEADLARVTVGRPKPTPIEPPPRTDARGRPD
ncbi:MAG: hypothetical protein FWD83_00330 [Promicromonosporaceae bacterium]|nr:hypothetical protein [Promicromonosporaceae bacterium]